MTTTHIDLPRAIDARKGDHLRLVLDCVAGDEGLVVEDMAVRDAVPAKTQNGEDTDPFDRMIAMARSWDPGPLSHTPDHEIRRSIAADMEAKHSS